MICILPNILGYSIEDNLEPKLIWLQQRLKMDNEALSKMIQTQASLFCYNVDTNLEPTLNFFIEALGSESEAIALVKRYPRMFTSSLEKRLKPRLEQARDAGIAIDAACLTRMGQYTDEKWMKSLGQINKPN